MKRLIVISAMIVLCAAPSAGLAAGAYVQQFQVPDSAYVQQVPPGARPPVAKPARVKATPVARVFLNPQAGEAATPNTVMAVTPAAPGGVLPSVGTGANVALPDGPAAGRLPSVGSGAVGNSN